jgi:hypothetical protein
VVQHNRLQPATTHASLIHHAERPDRKPQESWADQQIHAAHRQKRDKKQQPNTSPSSLHGSRLRPPQKTIDRADHVAIKRCALGCRPTSVEIQRESGIQSFASWPGYPTSSLAVWVMRNSPVPQRRIQVRYVTVTKMRGYSCSAEVPVVSVSAVVEDFPHGSSYHIPTATTRRNRCWQNG